MKVVKALLGELEDDWQMPSERPNCKGVEKVGEGRSKRQNPLGVAWRSPIEGVTRPEAVLEYVRRFLSKLPLWEKVFSGSVFEDDELKVEEEAALLETLLEKCRNYCNEENLCTRYDH